MKSLPFLFWRGMLWERAERMSSQTFFLPGTVLSFLKDHFQRGIGALDGALVLWNSWRIAAKPLFKGAGAEFHFLFPKHRFSGALVLWAVLWNFWRTAAKRLFIRLGAESHFLFQSTVLAELWSFVRCFGTLEFLENRGKAFIYKVWSGITFPFPKHRFSGALVLWAVLWRFGIFGEPRQSVYL